MEKIKEFFKGKTIGFYIVILDIILALVLGITFFATYKGAMANNAASHLPEVIGVCILLGALLDCVTLAFPEYKFIHIAAIIAYCVSLMKEIYLIPNLIADQVNGVAYQGGNFGLNLFYIITQLVIIISAIVSCFLGLVSKEEEEKIESKIKEEGRFSKHNIIKMSSGGAVALVGVIAATSTLLGIKANASSNVNEKDKPLDDIQISFQDKVIDYDFDPTAIVYKEDTHPYKEATAEQIINNVSSSPDRFLHNKVYEFEGKYTEAYQGNFTYTYSYIYLWEDGLYNGTAAGTNIYGYWYNQTSEGDTCLVLKDTAGNDMVCEATHGDPYYDWFGDLKSTVNGGRTFKMNGFMYYPVIGMFVDTGESKLEYNFRDELDKNKWTVKQVRNDLRYGAIINPDELTWELPDTKVPGEQETSVTWGKHELTYSFKVKVGEDLGTYKFDYASSEVKKHYRYIDRFDPTGIICTRTLNESHKIIDMKEVPYEFDFANNKIKFPMPNKVTYEMPVTFDLTEKANTVKGKIGDKEISVIFKDLTTAKITDGTATTEVKVELNGEKGLASVKILSRVSGDEALFDSVPKEFGIEESIVGEPTISLEKFMRSKTKANSYNQKTDTFFIFQADGKTVTVLWEFDYQGMKEEYMECSFKLKGTTLTITKLIGTDSNNQFEWIQKTFDGLTDCAKADLPFYPY